MKRFWLGLSFAASLGLSEGATAQGGAASVTLNGVWLLTFSGTTYDPQGTKTKIKETSLVPFSDSTGSGFDIGSFGLGSLSVPAATGQRSTNTFFAEGPGVSLACTVQVDPATGQGISCKGIATFGAGGSVGMWKVKGKRVLAFGPPVTLFAHDFESGLSPYVETDAAGAPTDTLWHAESSCAASTPIPAAMGSAAAAYNRGDESPPVYTYNTGSTVPNQGVIEGPPLTASGQVFGVTLRFDMLQETENQPLFFDQAFLEVKGAADPDWQTLLQLVGLAGCGSAPITVTVGPSDPILSGVAAGTFLHRFRFDTVDAGVNNFLGWYVDNFEIEVLNAVSLP